MSLQPEDDNVPSSVLRQACADSTFSDELEALHAQQLETAIDNKRKGIVIQHRGWRLEEAFRSDIDQSCGIPSSQPVNYWPTPSEEFLEATTKADSIGSSPPEAESMPFISSPVAYPPSSSPPLQSPTKRKRSNDARRSPLKETAANGTFRKPIAIFEEESDEASEDDKLLESNAPLAKRVKTSDLIDSHVSRLEHCKDHDLGSGDAPLHKGTSRHADTTEDPLSQPWSPRSTVGNPVSICTTSGKGFTIGQKQSKPKVAYEQIIAARSETAAGKAKRSYYGIEINSLLDEATAEAEIDSAKPPQIPALETIEVSVPVTNGRRPKKTLMWTEKYRARKFTDLIGDDRTHRSVMHWLKRWDQIVFPGSGRPKQKQKASTQSDFEEKPHRKILLLTGPPGLGKTTLAHVCAKQAGYEVQEINASDERSSNVVKGRIRDMVGTENVRGVDTKTSTGTVRKAGRPVCVIVDEVDGVVSGSGGSGEGGFIKALVDLIVIDQRNSRNVGTQQASSFTQKKTKGDNFRMQRPLILICNDVYHPSLRPLRQSTFAEIIHVGKPILNTIVARMQNVFQKEDIPCDSDGVRRLCEASWGVTSKKEGGSGIGTGEGDIRSIMVIGEMVAGTLRATINPASNSMQRLTRRWVEDNVLANLSQSGGGRGLGRGGSKEIVERVFQEGAGLSKSTMGSTSTLSGITGVKGVAEAAKSRAIQRLRELIDGFGESDRVITDCFSSYPNQPFQDDNFLSKPDAAYEWLQFHDTLSSAVYSSNEWELAPYLSQSILAFHHLFATSTSSRFSGSITKPSSDTDTATTDPHPLAGPQASYTAHEAQKQNHALVQSLQQNLSLPLTRLFYSTPDIATDLLPYLLRMVSPSVNPVLVSTSTGSGADKTRSSTASVRKASEKLLVARAVNAMSATGVRFERQRVELSFGDEKQNTAVPFNNANAGFVYRMEPALDTLGTFETAEGKGFATEGRNGAARYAVRQVLEQEFAREAVRLAEESRKGRYRAGGGPDEELGAGAKVGMARVEVLGKKTVVKRDFFGRQIVAELPVPGGDNGKEGEHHGKKRKGVQEGGEEGRTWLSFHEGFSNAVRKPVTLKELLAGL